MPVNNALKIFATLVLSTALEFPALAQTGDDSLFVTQVSQKAISGLLNLQKTDGPLYNGEMHYPHPKFKNGGHASFINSSYTKGTIVYDGLTYKNMSVMYDLIRDQLLLLNADSSGGIVVQPEHIDRFSLHNHNFINFKSGTVPKNIAPGYYDLLYEGRITLLAKRVKKVTENVTQYIEKEVEQTVSYYLLKDSVYTRIKGKQDLVTLLNATQKENQDYIKANKLDFNGNREEAFLRLVSFHDSLKQ
ncbi:hypothetical protein D3C87_303760 [compost metagenome]